MLYGLNAGGFEEALGMAAKAAVDRTSASGSKAGRSLVVAILGSKARAVAATRAKIRASGRNVHVFDGPGFGRKGPRH